MENFDKLCKILDILLIDDIYIFDMASEIHAKLRADTKEIGDLIYS